MRNARDLWAEGHVWRCSSLSRQRTGKGGKHLRTGKGAQELTIARSRPLQSNDTLYLATLTSVCGADFPTTTCCDQSQLETLSSSLAQAEPLIATCPGCKNNFVNYYCHFTCSPDQSQFLAVTDTQTITSGVDTKEAVKTVEVNVGRGFGEGFFASCRDVKFGATNG